METIETDIVVVGAGSAGCVVAGRLSERPDLSVILVEAGVRDWRGLTRIPAAVLKTIGHPRYDWRFKTEPDPTRNGRRDQWARGRMLGGSSAINGLIFVRGAKVDFEDWERLGNTGWGWDDVLPLYRRLETFDRTDSQARGGLGPQRVSDLSYRHPLTDPFIAAAGEHGIAFNPDLNGASQEGVGYAQGAIGRGLRYSAYDAFIAPNLERPNLRVLSGSHALEILFEGRRAAGVRIRSGQSETTIKGRKGVVLSLGSINTPQLLMLSGIGPAETLRKHGITVRADIAKVGQDLLDHTGFRLVVEVDRPTANNQAKGLRAIRHLTEWLLGGGRGPVGAVSAQALAFLRSRPEVDRPDIQLTLFPFANGVDARGMATLERRSLMSIGVNINYPRSRGFVTLRSADPMAPVEIHPRLMDHPDDVACLLAGLDMARSLATTGPFADHVTDRSSFPPVEAGREADLAYLRANARTYSHPISTCRMGVDAEAVVSPDLRLKGFDGLWVADASIFPQHISGNINATVLMIGEKASDLVASAIS